MADNLCGPSTPTKGLVNHLNGDRNLQQDRVVNTPVVAGSSSVGLTRFRPSLKSSTQI